MINKRPELVTSDERNDLSTLRDDLSNLTSHVLSLTSHVKEHGVQSTKYVAGLARQKADELQGAGRDGINALGKPR